jgi:hypothetical protein
LILKSWAWNWQGFWVAVLRQNCFFYKKPQSLFIRSQLYGQSTLTLWRAICFRDYWFKCYLRNILTAIP